MKKRMVSEGMKRARHMAVEARAKYAEIKADVESRVVRWEWTIVDRYSYEPAYFEIHKFPRGKVIADEKEAPIPPQQYGFDAEGRVIVERQYTEFPGMIYETFYVHEPDGIMQIRYNYYIPDKDLLGTQWFTLRDGRVVATDAASPSTNGLSCTCYRSLSTMFPASFSIKQLDGNAISLANTPLRSVTSSLSVESLQMSSS